MESVLTGAVAVVVAAASTCGLAFPRLYPEPASTAAMFRVLDAVNLSLSVPSLLLGWWLAERGSLRGRLLWAGTLAATVYTYVLYVFGLGFSAAFLLHAASLALALHALVLVLATTDRQEVVRRFRRRVPVRIAGTVLGLLGLGLGLGGTLLFSGVLQQAGYLTQLAAQSRAGIPGAAGTDPNEPPIVVAYLAGSVALLAAAPSLRSSTGLNGAALG